MEPRFLSPEASRRTITPTTCPGAGSRRNGRAECAQRIASRIVAHAEAGVRLRVKPFAGTLFAAVDGRLSGLTRRYACSLSVAWVTLERKLLTVRERPARRWRRSGRAAPRRSAIVLRPTSRWPQQCSLQKAAEPKETAESGSAHAPSDHGASSGRPRPRGIGARSAPPLPQPRQAAHFQHARLTAPAVRAAPPREGRPTPDAQPHRALGI